MAEEQPVQHPIQHVVFDIGGVLISHVRSWREAHERTTLPWHDYLGTPEFMQATRESVYAHMSGRISSQEWYDLAAAASQGHLSSEGARAVLEAWLYEDYPRVDEVVEEIHAAGRITATLSNTNPVHWEQMLTTSRVLPRIHHPHASHLLGAAKPQTEIFEAFERTTGFERHTVLYFDDVTENVEVARAFGWRAEHIDHTGDPAAQLRDHLNHHRIFE
jgi:HAD superfamily hydrolase (TIGR01509 family)